MDAFFGQQAGSRGPRPRTRRGQDALIRINLELAEAAFGVTRELKVDTAVVCSVCAGAGTAPGSHPTRCATCQGQGEISQVQRSFLGEVRTMRPCPTCRGFGTVIHDPCSECSGDGRVRARRAITVAVPAGVDVGTRIQLSGEGEVGPGGGPAGDLYVEIDVARHPVFTRQGDDLLCTHRGADDRRGPRDHRRAADPRGRPGRLGSTSEVERTIPLDIRPGTQSGERLIARARGVPRLRGSGRGDVIATVTVETPTKLDAAQADLLRQLADAARRGAAHHRPGRAAQERVRPVQGRARRSLSDGLTRPSSRGGAHARGRPRLPVLQDRRRARSRPTSWRRPTCSVAFRDLDPQAPTHVLVIPRRHSPTLPELAAVDPPAAADVLMLARRVALAEGLEAGYRVVLNNGAAAQQTVFHAHAHVLGGRPFTWPPG